MLELLPTFLGTIGFGTPVVVGDADFVYPPLRCGSRRVSDSNPEWAEIGQFSEGEDGRKTNGVGERDRVEVFCGKCGNMRDMTLGWQTTFDTPRQTT